MNEMIANQFFITGKYSEALDEYSRLPIERQSDSDIKVKMMICSTLDENFQITKELLKNLTSNDLNYFTKQKSKNSSSQITNLLNNLEISKNREEDWDSRKRLKIAILNTFFNHEIAKQQLNKLQNSNYADIANAFLQKLNEII